MKQLQESESSEEDDLLLSAVEEVGEIHGLYQPPIKVPVQIDGSDVEMELDTGASISVCDVRKAVQAFVAREEPKYNPYQIANLFKATTRCDRQC